MGLINKIKRKEITLLVKIKGYFFYAGPYTIASLAYMIEPAVLTTAINGGGLDIVYRLKYEIRIFLAQEEKLWQPPEVALPKDFIIIK